MRIGRLNLQTKAAEFLYHCLLEMGEQSSNPVLQLLDSSLAIEQNKKYPQGFLQFNDMGWRAYYHCHANNEAINHLFEAEHGHFHIFARLSENPETWSHVAALSIDDMGQPLRWFMVNHWVTGETWLNAPLLLKQIQHIPFNEQSSLLERWILSILAVHEDEINQLLVLRDQGLTNSNSLDIAEELKQDRSFYLLAEQAINLQNKLEMIFGQNK